MMKTQSQTEAILNRKLLTSTEEDTLARHIARQAFNQYRMNAADLLAAFENVVSWNPAVCIYDAPVRHAKVSAAASSRVQRLAIRYVREWTSRQA